MDALKKIEAELILVRSKRLFLRAFASNLRHTDPFGHSGKFAQEYANLLQENIDRLVNERLGLWWESLAGLEFSKSVTKPILDSLSQPSYMRQLFVIKEVHNDDRILKMMEPS